VIRLDRAGLPRLLERGREFALFAGVTAIARSLAVLFPTTWEWDVLTRAVKALEASDRGLWRWVASGGDTVWLPGYHVLVGALTRALPHDPIAIGEWVSALALGATFAFTRRLADSAGLGPGRSWVVLALLATSGHLWSYGSKAMTDAPAVALFVIALHFLLRLGEQPRWVDGVCAALALLGHATLRWEGVMYAAVLPTAVAVTHRHARTPGAAARNVSLLATAIPTGIAAAAFLWLARAATGHADTVIRTVAAVQSGDPMYFHGDAVLAVAHTVAALVLASGSLWVAVGPAARASLRPEAVSTATGRAVVVLTGVAAFHIAWFWAFAVAGLSSGWARHLLLAVPLFALLVVATPSSRRKVRWYLAGSAAFGVLALACNRYRHAAYVAGRLSSDTSPAAAWIRR
jgi:hypothetical protein